MVAHVTQGETIMSFQISGFVQFFQDLFETAPPQPLPVPQRGATLQEIKDFVKSLKLPADLRDRLVDARLPLFSSFFRAHGIDPKATARAPDSPRNFSTIAWGKPHPNSSMVGILRE
jgi:hypothetical protein